MNAIISPNRETLRLAAEALRPLLPELVFVGGHVAELLVTDPGASRVRETDDVDVIVEVTTYQEYQRLGVRLEAVGFSRDNTPGAPVCRWLVPAHDGQRIKVDVMPTAETRIGPTNPWFTIGMATAQRLRLTESIDIRILSAPAFLATKWAAFLGRGLDDVLMSHDVEDVIAVVAGRASLLDEVIVAPLALRAYIVACTRDFLAREDSESAMEDALPDARLVPGILTRVQARLAAIAAADRPSNGTA